LKILTAEQMQKIDQMAMNDYSISESILMENAGIKSAMAICETYPDIAQKNILIVCGPGNNGGDGFVIARHLHNLGTSVTVITTQPSSKYKGVTAENLQILKKMNVLVFEITSESSIYEALNMANFSDIIIDAIFGTGLSKHVDGLYLALINGLNSIPVPKIAIDIPSGINGTTGLVMGAAIKAAMTVTFAAPKIGHVLDPGSQYIGKIYVADISIPKNLLNSDEFKVNITTEEYVKERLRPRPENSNKGDFGRVLLIGGSKLYSGAPKIACNALLKSGAGISYMMVPDAILQQAQACNTDAIIVGLKTAEDGHISDCDDNIRAVLNFINKNKITAVGIGMGLSDNNETANFTAEILSKLEVPVCLDADGLWAITKYAKKVFANKNLKMVITPHLKEMSKIINMDITGILLNRISICNDFSRDKKCVTLLKGHRSVICDETGTTFVNTSGNAALAKGGMGDALTGLIAGFLGQGMTLLNAAVCGSYVHGKAADLAVSEIFEYSLTTADIINQLPQAMSLISGKKAKNS